MCSVHFCFPISARALGGVRPCSSGFGLARDNGDDEEKLVELATSRIQLAGSLSCSWVGWFIGSVSDSSKSLSSKLMSVPVRKEFHS
jgi:hypothetical protein